MKKGFFVILIFSIFTIFFNNASANAITDLGEFKVYDSKNIEHQFEVKNDTITVFDFDDVRFSLYFNLPNNSIIEIGTELTSLKAVANKQQSALFDTKDYIIRITGNGVFAHYTLIFKEGISEHEILDFENFSIIDQLGNELKDQWDSNNVLHIECSKSVSNVTIYTPVTNTNYKVYVNDVLVKQDLRTKINLTSDNTTIKIETVYNTDIRIYTIIITRIIVLIDLIVIEDHQLLNSNGEVVQFKPDVYTYYIETKEDHLKFNTTNSSTYSVSGNGEIEVNKCFIHEIVVTYKGITSTYYFNITKIEETNILDFNEVKVSIINFDDSQSELTQFELDFDKYTYSYGPYIISNNTKEININFDVDNATKIEYLGNDSIHTGLNIIYITIYVNFKIYVYQIQIIKEFMRFSIVETISFHNKTLVVTNNTNRYLTYKLHTLQLNPADIDYTQLITSENNLTVELISEVNRNTREALLKVSNGYEFEVVTIEIEYGNFIYEFYYQVNDFTLKIILGLVGVLFVTFIMCRRDHIFKRFHRRRRVDGDYYD